MYRRLGIGRANRTIDGTASGGLAARASHYSHPTFRGLPCLTVGLATAAAGELQRRADSTRSAEDAHQLDMLARSADAHVAMARSDTATTFRLLETLLREPLPPGVAVDWNIGLPRAPDRLLFARLLVARGDYRRAIAVADVFESPSPSIYLLYVPASLQLRADAAAALSDRAQAEGFRGRLVAPRDRR